MIDKKSKIEIEVIFFLKDLIKKRLLYIDFSKTGRNLEWRCSKGNNGDCIFMLPEENSRIYALNPGSISYRLKNSQDISFTYLLSLIKRSYTAAKKVLGDTPLKFSNDFSLIFYGDKIGKLSSKIETSVKKVGEELFGEPKLKKIREADNYIHIGLKPKEVSFDQIFNLSYHKGNM